jgi:hypothetical protein
MMLKYQELLPSLPKFLGRHERSQTFSELIGSCYDRVSTFVGLVLPHKFSKHVVSGLRLVILRAQVRLDHVKRPK